MAPHSSTLAWKIPWTEEPGRLQSMGLRRVGHDWVTSLSLPCIGEGNGNPLQCSCLENPRDEGARWAAVYEVAQSRTRLKWRSSSSSSWEKEKAMAPHSSTPAWKIPWMGEPGRLQSMESLRVGHDWATSLSLFTFMHWRRKWQPSPVFLPGESQGWGSLVGCHLWGRTESDTTEVTQQQRQHNIYWRRQWHPLQYCCLENPRDRGAWWTAVYGVAQSRAQLSDFTCTFTNIRWRGITLQTVNLLWLVGEHFLFLFLVFLLTVS